MNVANRQTSIGILGIGVISPFGLGCEAIFKNFADNTSTIPVIEECNVSLPTLKLCGPIDNRTIEAFLGSRGARLPDMTRFAMCSTLSAIKSFSISERQIRGTDTGIFAGCEQSNLLIESIYSKVISGQLENVKPLEFQECVANAPASHLNILLKIQGESYVCTQGSHALYTALIRLSTGGVSIAIVCGVDEYKKVHHDAYKHLGLLRKAVSPDLDNSNIRKNVTDGAVYLEGSISLILGSSDDMNAIGTIEGFGMSCDPSTEKEELSIVSAVSDAVNQATSEYLESGNVIDLIFISCGGIKPDRKVWSKALKCSLLPRSNPPVVEYDLHGGCMRCSAGLTEIVLSTHLFLNGPKTIHFPLFPDLSAYENEELVSKMELNPKSVLIISNTLEGICNAFVIKEVI